MKKKQKKNIVLEKVKYIIGYVLYRLAYFEDVCRYDNSEYTNVGFTLGTSLALYIVNLCHYLGYDFALNPMFIFVGSFTFIFATILNVCMWKKWKKLKAKYLHDIVGNEDWTLKGWFIVLVLFFPLILVFTWFER